MDTTEIKKHKEAIAAKVHDAWWDEKKRQGFHAPEDCQSGNAHTNRVLNTFDRLFEYCPRCHTDMYPYAELPENIKDYDRVTVDSVLNAIEMLPDTDDDMETIVRLDGEVIKCAKPKEQNKCIIGECGGPELSQETLDKLRKGGYHEPGRSVKAEAGPEIKTKAHLSMKRNIRKIQKEVLSRMPSKKEIHKNI